VIPRDGGGGCGDGGATTFVLRPRRNPPAVLSALIPGAERYKYIVRFQGGEVCFRDAYHDENFRGRCGGLSSSLASTPSSGGRRRARVSERHGSFADGIRMVNDRIVDDRRRVREERWLRDGVYSRGGSMIVRSLKEPVC